MEPLIGPHAQHLLDRWVYVLVRVEEEFLLPYTASAWRRIGEEGGYGAEFLSFLERFLRALADPAWAAGTYFPGGWYRLLQGQGKPPSATAFTPAAAPQFYTDEVVVEADGRWRVGHKWIEGPVLRHFLRNLHFDPAVSRYVIRYYNLNYFETRYIRHESPPFRVERVLRQGEQLLLQLNDDSSELLRPETLRLDDGERLYAAVKSHGLPAIFENNPRWQVLDRVEERGRELVLLLGGREASLQLHAPRTYAE